MAMATSAQRRFAFAACLLALASGCVDAIRERIEDRLDAEFSDAADAGSGEGSGVPLCDGLAAFAPCGGDPVGIWRLTGWCIDGASWDPLRGTCPDITSEGSGEASGRLEIFGDGGYLLYWDRLERAMTFRFGLWCFGGDATACNGTFYDGTCGHDGTVCTCQVADAYEDAPESGTWSQSGLRIAFESVDGSWVQPFCVSGAGDVLTLGREATEQEPGFTARYRRVE